jgi:hypothetical protein
MRKSGFGCFIIAGKKGIGVGESFVSFCTFGSGLEYNVAILYEVELIKNCE